MIPAVLIVPIYFLTIVKEILVDKRSGRGPAYEKRFAAVRDDLPAHIPFNYVSDHSEQALDWFYARYALIPARMVRGLKPKHELRVVQ